MKVKRLTLTLPPHLANTAVHDARLIADAVGTTLHKSGAKEAPAKIELAGRGLSGAVLAQEIGAKIGPAKGGGGHGG